MVRIKVSGRIADSRKYRRRNAPFREAHNEGFKKVEDPGALYIDKLEPFPGIYTRHEYGLYIQGDGTLNTKELRIMEFATRHEAEKYKQELEKNSVLEKIRTRIFAHKEERIYYTPDDFISSDYYYQVYPQLRKYKYRKIDDQVKDWFVFIKNLGLRSEEPHTGC